MAIYLRVTRYTKHSQYSFLTCLAWLVNLLVYKLYRYLGISRIREYLPCLILNVQFKLVKFEEAVPFIILSQRTNIYQQPSNDYKISLQKTKPTTI